MLTQKYPPRTPTQNELNDIIEAFNTFDDFDNREDIYSYLLNDCAVVAFDHYITDTPGYCGKVLIVIFSGSPDLVYSIVYHNAKPYVTNHH